jgi:hypothetical protein
LFAGGVVVGFGCAMIWGFGELEDVGLFVVAGFGAVNDGCGGALN